jgi:hypothetical protein
MKYGRWQNTELEHYTNHMIDKFNSWEHTCCTPVLSWTSSTVPIGRIYLASRPLKIASTADGSVENGNWSSFQLANSAPPLSVTGSAIAPSARMISVGQTKPVSYCDTDPCGADEHASYPRGHPVMVYTNYINVVVGGRDRTKILKLTLDALRTRQSLVKGERLVRHEMRAVLMGHREHMDPRHFRATGMWG